MPSTLQLQFKQHARSYLHNGVQVHEHIYSYITIHLIPLILYSCSTVKHIIIYVSYTTFIPLCITTNFNHKGIDHVQLKVWSFIMSYYTYVQQNIVIFEGIKARQ